MSEDAHDKDNPVEPGSVEDLEQRLYQWWNTPYCFPGRILGSPWPWDEPQQIGQPLRPTEPEFTAEDMDFLHLLKIRLEP